jgi:hypothetical protein
MSRRNRCPKLAIAKQHKRPDCRPQQAPHLGMAWCQSRLPLLPSSVPGAGPPVPSPASQRHRHPVQQGTGIRKRRHISNATKPDVTIHAGAVAAECALDTPCLSRGYMEVEQEDKRRSRPRLQPRPSILQHVALLFPRHALVPGLTVMSKGLLSTSGALRAASMGSAANAPLNGVVVYRLLYTALGLAARASSSDGVLPSPEVSCRQQCGMHAVIQQYTVVHASSAVDS